MREIPAQYSGMADFSFVMQGLGSGPISLFGSEVMRRKYLPDVAFGRRIAAFALSEVDLDPTSPRKPMPGSMANIIS